MSPNNPLLPTRYRARQSDARHTGRAVLLVQVSHALKMRLERWLERVGEQRGAVLRALSGADEHQVHPEVQVFDAQRAAFHDAQSAAVDQ